MFQHIQKTDVCWKDTTFHGFSWFGRKVVGLQHMSYPTVAVRTRWAPITLDCLATAQVARNTHQKKEAVGIFRKKGVGGKFELSWMLVSKKNPSHVSWIKSERLWLKRHMIGLFDIILVEENIELLISSYTLPKTNISPENRGFPKGKLYSNHQLSGSMLVSGRVYHILRKLMKICIQSSLILLNEIRVDGHFLG